MHEAEIVHSSGVDSAPATGRAPLGPTQFGVGEPGASNCPPLTCGRMFQDTPRLESTDCTLPPLQPSIHVPRPELSFELVAGSNHGANSVDDSWVRSLQEAIAVVFDAIKRLDED